MENKERYISYLLRHNPEELIMDKHGWVRVDALLNKINISSKKLQEIVDTNNKKRFVFNDDKTKIRATQGHSLKVNLELKSKVPPKFLYHGTVYRNIKSIKKNGLSKMKRTHAHLSDDYETAVDVANRYGKDIYIFKIDTTPMTIDNIKFYQSDNGVWLVDHIDPKYL